MVMPLSSFETVRPSKRMITHPNDEVGERKLQTCDAISNFKLDKQLVIDHLRFTVASFTKAVIEVMEACSPEIAKMMEDRGRGGIFVHGGNNLPFTVNADKAIRAIEDGYTPRATVKLMAKLLRNGTTGLHANQIKTLVRSMVESSLELAKPGICILPPQAGKTGAALAHAVFLAPLMYRLAGIKFYPLFLSTHLDTHRSQTDREFNDALMLYGDLLLEVSQGVITPSEYYNMVNVFESVSIDSGYAVDAPIDEDFFEEATPNSYHQSILRGELDRASSNLKIVHNRRRGTSVRNLRQQMNAATKKGFSLLLLIDEPQHGASGTVTPTGKIKNGLEEYSGFVIGQVLVDIKQQLLQADGKHMAIGFSATPFDTANMAGFWNVLGYLSPNYVGPNCWMGKKIDPSVWMHPPKVNSLETISDETGNDDIKNLKRLLGIGRKGDETKNWVKAKPAFYALLDYMVAQRPALAASMIEERPELKETVLKMLAGVGGFCGRIVNDNDDVDDIIDMLGLDAHYQVFRYYGKNYMHESQTGKLESMTAREIIDEHYDPADPRPPFFVVTNRARMGDNIPKIIEMFFDLSEATSDLNALLQGLFGRSCGDSKFLSQVVLSKRPAGRLHDYFDTMGMPNGKTSPHAITMNGSVKRGRGAKIMRVGLIGPQANDPMIQRFIAEINRRIVFVRFPRDILVNKLTGGETLYPMAEIINSVKDEQGRNIYEYLSDPEVQTRLFPEYEFMRIVNPFNGEKIKHRGRAGDRMMGYDIRGDMMSVSFRHRPLEKLDDGHYGVSNRGARRTDRAVNSAAAGSEVASLEVQINCFKRRADNSIVTAEDADSMGYPEAYMVTFPLRAEVRQRIVVTGTPTTICTPQGWAADVAIEPERMAWAKAEAAAAERKRKRVAKNAAIGSV